MKELTGLVKDYSEAAGSLPLHSEGRLGLGRHSWAVATDNRVLALKRARTWTKVQEEEQFESQHTVWEQHTGALWDAEGDSEASG